MAYSFILGPGLFPIFRYHRPDELITAILTELSSSIAIDYRYADFMVFASSFLARAGSFFKMDILPKHLYIVGADDLRSKTFFVSLRLAIMGHIWANTTARLCYDILIRPKLGGGDSRK